MEARADFEKAYSSFYNAFRGTAAEPGGRSQEAGLSAGITLLLCIGSKRLFCSAGFGKVYFRLLDNAADYRWRSLRSLPGNSGCDVGIALPFHRERLALAAAADSAGYSAKNSR